MDVTPTFSWEESVDPDGNMVSYDFYLGTSEDEMILFAENLTEPLFEVNNRLSLYQNYYWMVTAKDSEGAATHSSTNMFITRGLNFLVDSVTDEAEFSGRNNFGSAIFRDKIWVVGGRDGSENGRGNDVWMSEDGKSWIEVDSNAPFVERSGHITISFKDKLWVIGGGTNDSRLNDIWYSNDGNEWVEIMSETKFSGRNLVKAVVFKDKLWVIGGIGQNNAPESDIWNTSDGITWTEITNQVPFPARFSHNLVVFDDKLWVLGGLTGLTGNVEVLGDVWSSEDGINWIEVKNKAEFGPRRDHTSVVFDEKMWVIGGNDGTDYLNDVWYSVDGITWTEAIEDAPFTGKAGHASHIFNNKIWVVGGFNRVSPVRKNDVWAFD